MGIHDHGSPSRPPARAAMAAVYRGQGFITWEGAEPHGDDLDRHKHLTPGLEVFAHSHNDGADAHDHHPAGE